MSEVIGRAGFHAAHTKNVAERGAILHEMMRELDEDSIAYWSSRNPNIVLTDEALNEAYVNDRNGGFHRCKDRTQVLDYGDDRIARVKRKFRDDVLNRKTGKMQGGTVTTTMIVAHLPKSMCVEIPDFYPVLDKKSGKPVMMSDGAPMMRSRYVARDRDQARRYFEDLLAVLEKEVIPGGHDGVHGFDIQHSESTPHVQILADTFAKDPDVPEALRVESSRVWFSHRDVRDENGRQKSGHTKLGEYHARLREALIEKGYDISPDFDEERHMTGFAKDDYARVKDLERRNTDRTVSISASQQSIEVKKAELAATSRRLSAQLTVITEEREAAIEEGRAEGKNEVAEQIWAARQARVDAEAAKTDARRREARLHSLSVEMDRQLQQAGPAPQPPSCDDLRNELLASQSSVMTQFLRSRRRADGRTLFDEFETYAKAEFAKQQRNADPLAPSAGARFENWRERTIAAQRKLDRANLTSRTELRGGEDDHEARL